MGRILRRAGRCAYGRRRARRGRWETVISKETVLLYTIALILLILWVLGLVTAYTAGGLLHILLVLAIIVVVYQLITGRTGP